MQTLTQDHYGTNGPLLVIAHGLFGSARNWRAISKALGRRARVVVVDMRNHGRSFRTEAMDYPAMAADLSQVIAEHGSKALVLGHSMGGKAAMMLALTAPHAVAGLVIGDIAPVRYGHGAQNEALADAMLALDLDRVTSRADAEAQLAQSVESPALRQFFLQSLEIEEGHARWQLNLPAIRAALPAIHDFPEVQAHYDGPVLALSGQSSDYVTRDGRAALDRLFPRLRHASLKGAGHWLHADQPRAFIATMEAFLDRFSDDLTPR